MNTNENSSADKIVGSTDGLGFLHKNIITLEEARKNLAGGFCLSRDMQIYLLFEVQRLLADYADVHADFGRLVEKLTGKAPNAQVNRPQQAAQGDNDEH